MSRESGEEDETTNRYTVTVLLSLNQNKCSPKAVVLCSGTHVAPSWSPSDWPLVIIRFLSFPALFLCGEDTLVMKTTVCIGFACDLLPEAILFHQFHIKSINILLSSWFLWSILRSPSWMTETLAYSLTLASILVSNSQKQAILQTSRPGNRPWL